MFRNAANGARKLREEAEKVAADTMEGAEQLKEAILGGEEEEVEGAPDDGAPLDEREEMAESAVEAMAGICGVMRVVEDVGEVVEALEQREQPPHVIAQGVIESLSPQQDDDDSIRAFFRGILYVGMGLLVPEAAMPGPRLHKAPKKGKKGR
jgi:hypothetical protein